MNITIITVLIEISYQNLEVKLLYNGKMERK